jgi:hypothetical protein
MLSSAFKITDWPHSQYARANATAAFLLFINSAREPSTDNPACIACGGRHGCNSGRN